MPLPRVARLSAKQRAVSALALGLASVLWIGNAVALARAIDANAWWVPFVFVGGVGAADLLSGLVHWSADTWGRDDLPIIGRRLLVPFRIHHVNPDDFLTRPFLDTNGEVAMLTVPVLVVAHVIPLDTNWGLPLATAALGLCGAGAMTNQIHQWAHMSMPPWPVRLLQCSGLILGRGVHAEHHAHPYDASYCITTGWCNAGLDRIGFFRTLERLITALTGVEPRQDDERYQTRVA